MFHEVPGWLSFPPPPCLPRAHLKRQYGKLHWSLQIRHFCAIFRGKGQLLSGKCSRPPQSTICPIWKPLFYGNTGARLSFFLFLSLSEAATKIKTHFKARREGKKLTHTNFHIFLIWLWMQAFPFGTNPYIPSLFLCQIILNSTATCACLENVFRRSHLTHRTTENSWMGDRYHSLLQTDFIHSKLGLSESL